MISLKKQESGNYVARNFNYGKAIIPRFHIFRSFFSCPCANKSEVNKISKLPGIAALIIFEAPKEDNGRSDFVGDFFPYPSKPVVSIHLRGGVFVANPNNNSQKEKRLFLLVFLV